MKGFRPTLTVSILASLACLLTLTWIMFSLFAFKTAEMDLYAQKGENARILLLTFVNQLPDEIPHFPNSMLHLDSPAAIYGTKLADSRSIERMTLLDDSGKVVFTAGIEGSDIYLPFSAPERLAGEPFVMPGGGKIAVTITVARSGKSVGKAGIVVSLADEKARIHRSRQLFVAYFALDFILLLAIGSYFLSRIVVNPVNRLLSATERIAGGEYGSRVPVAGTMELARLSDSFNNMSANLKQKEDEVRSHVKALEEANANLKLAREEAVRSEKMASVGLLAAGTAHEIGTPLASVMGYAEIMLAELEDDSVKADYLRRMMEGCSRIDRIVRGLIDYARPRQSTFQEVDAARLLEETVELLQHQGLLKKCLVDNRTLSELPVVNLDPYQLQQVIINLMLNAADSMPDGGVMTLVTTHDISEELLKISIKDTGSGIPQENLSRIFDPFFTTKEPGKGTGLGLAISARIMESFGGRILVSSQEGEGSCFTILLPAINKTASGETG